MTRLAASRGDGERLDGEVVEVGAVGEALAELGGLGLQLLVGQALQLGLERVDVGHHGLQRLELLALAGAEDAIEDAHAGFEPTGWPGSQPGRRSRRGRRASRDGSAGEPTPAQVRRRVPSGWRPAHVSP